VTLPAERRKDGLALPAIHEPTTEEPVSMAVMRREDFLAGVGGTSDLLLGGGVEFEGKLTFEGTVRIDSKFTGSINTRDVLLIGEHARVTAELTCGTVIIQGEVNGNIKATAAVELRQPARVRGNIESPSISIEKGAFFQGELKMELPTRGTAPAKPVVAAPAPAPSSSASAS
jgi:cytoskeletal protein CcmA (bactofilin family)